MIDLSTDIQLIEARIRNSNGALKNEFVKSHNLSLDLFRLDVIQNTQSFPDDELIALLSQIVAVYALDKIYSNTYPDASHYLKISTLKGVTDSESSDVKPIFITEAFQETVLDIAHDRWDDPVFIWKTQIKNIGDSNSRAESYEKLNAVAEEFALALELSFGINLEGSLQDYVDSECKKRFIRAAFIS